MLKDGKVENVQQIRNTLYDIHKCLLDHQANETAIRLQRRIDPYELWRMSLEDPDFAWLRVISSMIVTLDEEMEMVEDLSEMDISHMVSDLKSLFFSPEFHHRDFNERIESIKDLNPDLLLLMGELLKEIDEVVGPMRLKDLGDGGYSGHKLQQ